MDMLIERKVYTVNELTVLYGVSRNTIYAAMRAGEIPCLRLRGRMVAPKAEVDSQLEGKEVAEAREGA